MQKELVLAKYYRLHSSTGSGDALLKAPADYIPALILADFKHWAREHGWSSIDSYSVRDPLSKEEFDKLWDQTQVYNGCIQVELYTDTYEFTDKLQKMRLKLHKKG